MVNSVIFKISVHIDETVVFYVPASNVVVHPSNPGNTVLLS